MNIHIITILIFLISINFGVSQEDNVWVMRDFTMSFSNGTIQLDTLNQPIDFARTKGSICDENGNLLFYTNGCEVINADNELMPNGDSLNFNNYYEDWIQNCDGGYLVSQGLIILPDPANSYGYYIIHKPTEMVSQNGNIDFISNELRYSYVDMRLNEGLGDVTTKNVNIFNGELKKTSYLTAIKHDNKKDWWIINPSEKGNSYYKMILTDEGFTKLDSQSIGPQFHVPPPFVTGNSKFSPDGSLYAYFNVNDGLHLYNFNRLTGEFSNEQFLQWQQFDQFNWGGTIEFSPDSKLLYICNEDQLFQLSLDDISDQDNLILIDEYDGTLDPFKTTFFFMSLAPDCKIYLAPGSSSNAYHVIHSPNKKGLECNFIQRDLNLPKTSSLGGFPYFPRYRIEEERPCFHFISDCPEIDELIFCEEWLIDTLTNLQVQTTQENKSLSLSSWETENNNLFYVEICSEQNICSGSFYNCEGNLVGISLMDSIGNTVFMPDSIERYSFSQDLWNSENEIPLCGSFDQDGDGFPYHLDCNDTIPQINPSMVEIPYNSWDDDCDSSTLDDDLDEDGFVFAEDCNDTINTINPSAEEIPNNGIDEDCDGEDLITKTNEPATNPKIIFYPNPSKETVTISVKQRSDYLIKIFDVTGKLFLTKSFQLDISVSDLPHGMYYFFVYDDHLKLLDVNKQIILK